MPITMEEISKSVRGELDDIKSVITSEIRDNLSAESAERHRALEEDIAEIHKSLEGLQARGDVAPNSATVKDLEKRLEETQAKLAGIEEAARLDKTQPMTPRRSNSDRPMTLEELDWRGIFVKNPEALRQVIRQRLAVGEEVRALDSSLFSSGGRLSAETADAFIDFVISQQAGLSRVTTLRMASPQGHTDELRVSARKMRKAAEGTAPTVADGVTNKRRTLTTVETIWAEDLTLTLLEDAIERRGTEGHIARLLGLGFGNDLNDLAWNGDEDASDDFLSINDGWIILAENDADVNDVDSFGSSIDSAAKVFHEMWKAVPAKFLGRVDYVYFVPVALAQNYADQVSSRETGLGDQVLVNGFPALRYFGKLVVPEVHLATLGAKAMLTPTANLHFGIQRAVNVDSEWRPRKRAIEYTITARTDYEYATGEAIVLAANIPSDLL